MSFKYINPGYGNLLNLGTATVSTEEKYNPTNKVSFWQNDKNDGITLDECPQALYGKFDVYLHHDASGSSDFKMNILLNNETGVTVKRYSDDWYVIGLVNGLGQIYFHGSKTYSTVTSKTNLELEKVNTIYFSFTQSSNSSTNDGEGKIWVNGTLLASEKCNIQFNNKTTINIYSTSENIMISNIILSDEEFSMKEKVVSVPVISSETDMIDRGDGSFMATKADQKLLQKPDAAYLSDAYGEDAKVTGIALIGNPAYRTEEEPCTLTGISRSGETITEYGTHKLSTETATGVTDSWKADMTMTELAQLELGWKAGN